MKFILALLAAAVALAVAAPLTESQYEFLFTRFTTEYSKEYRSNEFFSKYNTFKTNLNTVMAHNAAKNSTYTMAMNEFGDLTFEEFSAKLGLKPVKRDFARSLTAKPYKKIHDGVYRDWRTHGAVNAIKSQAQCGSSWAFSANAAIEGANAIKNGKLYDLSESQLVDCSASYGNHGCNGGLMDNAFEYVIDNGGLCETKDYPYVPMDSICKANQCEPVATIKSYSAVAQNDDALISAATETVVAVAIEAGMGIQFYSSGVFSGRCGHKLNHGVAVVGVNVQAIEGYYIVRNSWGTSWGERGYIRMATGKNICGITIAATITDA